MPRICFNIDMLDIREVDVLQIEITEHGDKLKVWINGPDGCLLRAYNVGAVQFSETAVKLARRAPDTEIVS